jgi:hypothetical protein
MSGDVVVVVPPGEGEVVPRRFGERTVVKAAEADNREAIYLRYGLEIVGPPPAS